MKVVPLMVMLAILTGPAFAQQPGINLLTDIKRPLTSEEIERQKAIDDAYKASISKIPDQKVNDPWGTVRTAPATKPTNAKPTRAQSGAK